MSSKRIISSSAGTAATTGAGTKPVPLRMSEMSRGRSVRRASTVSGATVSLSYPYSQAPAPESDLGALTDERSSYQSVLRSCLSINQFAGGLDSVITHDNSFVRTTTLLFSALTQCMEAHQDRRARVLACQTLALMARSAYARIRHSPLLFASREGMSARLEDEVGTDIAVALCGVALEDTDDGVSATAVESLGILTLSSQSLIGFLGEDELLREMESISHARPSPYAPSLQNVSDEDPSIPQMELLTRVIENVLVPRIWRLTRRILNYCLDSCKQKALPFLTATLVHLLKINQSTKLNIDQSVYAKRWIEVDLPGMIQDILDGIIKPALSEVCCDRSVAYTAAMSALRLIHVRPSAPWVMDICRLTSSVLAEQLEATGGVIEHTMGAISALIVSLRGIPLEERGLVFPTVLNHTRQLPATTMTPKSVTSPGIAVGNFYHRPARIGYFTEMALSFLVDGPPMSTRNEFLQLFMSSPEVESLLSSRSLASGGKQESYVGTHPAEEFVLAFCRVSSSVGNHLLSHNDSPNTLHHHDWIKSTLTILRACSGCLRWNSRTTNEEDDQQLFCTMLAACQIAYLTLLIECFYAAGILSPISSITLHLIPLSTPAQILLLEDLAQSISDLAIYQPIKGADFALNHTSDFLHLFWGDNGQDGTPSRHIFMVLIAVCSDEWVQSFMCTQDIRDMHRVHKILDLLSTQISSLTAELIEDIDNEILLRYLDVCVAAVENIALIACDFARSNLLYNDPAANHEIEDTVAQIVHASRSALGDSGLRQSSNGHHHAEEQISICHDASLRIESALPNGRGVSEYTIPIHSALVSALAHDYQMRLSHLQAGEAPQFSLIRRSPLFDDDVETPLVRDDFHIHTHLVHYCQQIIGSRTDLSLHSSPLMNLAVPTVDSNEDGADELGNIRRKSLLRLTPPVLPPDRGPLFGTPLGSRVSWSGSVTALSGGSDPISFLMAYSMRRCQRFDCEPEFKLMVSLRVHNLTAVEIVKGLRMDLRVTQQRSAFETEGEVQAVLKSLTASHKQEVKADDQVTWEIAVEHWPMKGYIELHPSVTFREVDGEQTAPKVVCGEPPLEDDLKSCIESRCHSKSTATDDESIGAATNDNSTDGQSVDERVFGDEEDEAMDIVLSSEPVQLSPMLGMQPCPLVFFKDGRGDVGTFRFLWYQMPHRMPEMMLYPSQLPGRLIGSSIDDFAVAVAGLSTIPIDEYIDDIGTVTSGWAFMTLKGDRMMCIMIESVEMDETGIESPMATLHFRADNEALLYSIMGSDSTRNVVVNSLTGDQWTCDDQVNALLGL